MMMENENTSSRIRRWLSIDDGLSTRARGHDHPDAKDDSELSGTQPAMSHATRHDDTMPRRRIRNNSEKNDNGSQAKG